MAGFHAGAIEPQLGELTVDDGQPVDTGLAKVQRLTFAAQPHAIRDMRPLQTYLVEQAVRQIDGRERAALEARRTQVTGNERASFQVGAGKVCAARIDALQACVGKLDTTLVAASQIQIL